MANYTLHLLYVELHIVGFLFLIDGLLAMPELRIVTSRLARLQSIIDQEVVARAVGANDPLEQSATRLR